MHGCVIEHRPCPRCDNRRTARFGATAFCFNCHSRVADESFEFTRDELRRLAMYRDAVRAGLYTDQVETQRSV